MAIRFESKTAGKTPPVTSKADAPVRPAEAAGSPVAADDLTDQPPELPFGKPVKAEKKRRGR